MTAIPILFLLILFTFSSSALGQSAAPGKKIEVIEYIAHQYYPTDTTLAKPFWDFNDKIWFKDSLAIEEVRFIKMHEEPGGISCLEYPISHYRFSDLRKGFIYEFNSFRDSAGLIRKYTYADSIMPVGGWGFNYNRNGDGTHVLLPDTVIDNVSYKRAKISRGTEDQPYIVLCYSRCDKKGTVFNLIPNLSTVIGCPITRTYVFSPRRIGLHLTQEVKFIADTLTAAEQRVFDAWEKYATLHPAGK